MDRNPYCKSADIIMLLSREKIKKHDEDLLKHSSIIVASLPARQENKTQHQNEFNRMGIIILSSKFCVMSEEYEKNYE